jgi:hypothetical protein
MSTEESEKASVDLNEFRERLESNAPAANARRGMLSHYTGEKSLPGSVEKLASMPVVDQRQIMKNIMVPVPMVGTPEWDDWLHFQQNQIDQFKSSRIGYPGTRWCRD